MWVLRLIESRQTTQMRGERVFEGIEGLRKNQKQNTHMGIKKKKKKMWVLFRKEKLFSPSGSDLLIITLLLTL